MSTADLEAILSAIRGLERENERLNAEVDKLVRTSNPALARAHNEESQACIAALEGALQANHQLVARNAELERDKARLDWLLFNPLTFPPVQIPCPDGRPGCLVYHCRPQTPSECRSTIDAAMEGKP